MEPCFCYNLKATGVEGGTGQTAHERDLHRRIAELEAELADVVRRHNENCGRENATLLRRIAEFEKGYARLEAENRAMWEALGRPLSIEPARKERDDG